MGYVNVYLQAIGALGGSNWGLEITEKRQIYIACVAPVFSYAAWIWYIPRIRGWTKSHDKQVRALTAIQRRAGRVISGGFHLTGIDAFNAELAILPTDLLLQRTQQMATMRLMSSPVYEWLNEQRIHHQHQLLQSGLEHTENTLSMAEIDIARIEIRLPFAIAPWWTPPSSLSDRLR